MTWINVNKQTFYYLFIITDLFRNLLQISSDVKHIAIGAGGLGFDSRAGQIGTVLPTARHRCDNSSELCYPDAKPPRWIPRHVTRFDVIPQV